MAAGHRLAARDRVANGRGVSLTPKAGARFSARPGIVYRPVGGVAPSSVGICRRRGDDRAVVHDLLHVCRTT
jgi:hypothetical protein